MKQLFTLMAAAWYCTAASAQSTTESAKNDSISIGNITIATSQAGAAQDTSAPGSKSDTIKIGNIIIVNNGEKSSDSKNPGVRVFERRRRDKPANVSTNWFIVDLGFSNYVNKTGSYSPAGTEGYLFNRTGAAPLGENDFDLNIGKSINVNIWVFMQRLNLIKHHVHLKYGLGLELNNYRYRSQLSYLRENPFVTGVTPAPVIIRDSVSFSKNKLAADYLTVPLMLNFSTNRNDQNKGFSVSFGVSAGYLYSQRNKQISDERGKKKTKDGLGLEQFKFSYIGEIGLGPVRLYGSYSPNSFYKKALDMRPYTLGIRLSNW